MWSSVLTTILQGNISAFLSIKIYRLLSRGDGYNNIQQNQLSTVNNDKDVHKMLISLNNFIWLIENFKGMFCVTKIQIYISQGSVKIVLRWSGKFISFCGKFIWDNSYEILYELTKFCSRCYKNNFDVFLWFIVYQLRAAFLCCPGIWQFLEIKYHDIWLLIYIKILLVPLPFFSNWQLVELHVSLFSCCLYLKFKKTPATIKWVYVIVLCLRRRFCDACCLCVCLSVYVCGQDNSQSCG